MIKIADKNIIAALALALTVRIGYIAAAPTRPSTWDDAGSWDAVAWNARLGNGLLEADGTPTSQRPPGYPLFLAAVYFIFGHSHFWAKIFQALAGAMSVFLVFAAARRVFGEKIAMASAWALAVYPPLIVYTGIIGSETVFTTTLAAAALALTAAFRSDSKKAWALAGFAFGVNALTRSTTVFLPVWIVFLRAVFACPLLHRFFMAPSGRPAVGGERYGNIAKTSAVFLLVYCAALFPWCSRNYLTLGRFSPIASGGGGLFWAGAKKSFDGRAAERTMEHYYDEMKGRSFAEQDSFAFKQGVKEIYSDPLGYAGLTAKKFFRGIFLPVGKVLLERKSFALAAAVSALHAVWIIAAVFGLWVCRRDALAGMTFAPVIFYFVAVNTLLASIPRYRLPSEPFIMVYAAAGVFAVLKMFAPSSGHKEDR